MDNESSTTESGGGTDWESWGCLIGIILLGIGVIIFVLFLMTNVRKSFSSHNALSGNNSKLVYPAAVNPDDIKDCIDKYIQELSPGSPLKGEWFASAGQKNNIDPAFLVAIAQKETSLANNGIYDYSKPSSTQGGQYNIGNIDSTDGTFVNYSSYTDGVDGLAAYLNKGYFNYASDPRTNLRAIAYLYCPPKPDKFGKVCNTEQWITDVQSIIDKIRSNCGYADAYSIGGAQNASSIISAAQGEVGTRTGANKAYQQANPGQYCVDFVRWSYAQAGYTLPAISRAPDMYTSMSKDPNYYTFEAGEDTPQPGDIAFIATGNYGSGISGIDHAEIVTSVNANGSVNTIGGNTGMPDGGTGVANKTRSVDLEGSHGSAITFARPR